MTMSVRPRSIAAGRFKAGCLALIDDVAATRREIVITKRGKPLARLVPLEPHATEPGAGLIEYQGDLISPIDAEWDASR
jgi:prevent-host-death family protein